MPRPKMKFLFNGEMLTAKKIQELTGLSPRAQRLRRSKGIPLEREVKWVTEAQTFDFKGQKLTLAEISQRTGQKVETLRSWANKGLNLAECQAQQSKRYLLRGQMVTVAEASDILRMTPTAIRNRIRRFGVVEPFRLADRNFQEPIYAMSRKTEYKAAEIWQMMQDQKVSHPSQLVL